VTISTGPRRYRATLGVEPAELGWLRKRVDGPVAAEVAKAEAMHAALEGTLYRAPRARPGGEVGTMLVEDLGDLVSITEIAEHPQEGALRDAAVHAGRILALLHARMPQHLDGDVVAAERTAASGPFHGDVLLHGDFSPTNVFVDGDGRFVTLDGSPNFITSTSPFTFGRPSTDLATFTVVLCWPLRPLHWRPGQLRARLDARRRFLDAYEAESGVTHRGHLVREVALFIESIWFRKIRPRRKPR
jgi:aminoglycoside phosphotransferase (APT) family kinase protein